MKMPIEKSKGPWKKGKKSSLNSKLDNFKKEKLSYRDIIKKLENEFNPTEEQIQKYAIERGGISYNNAESQLKMDMLVDKYGENIHKLISKYSTN